MYPHRKPLENQNDRRTQQHGMQPRIRRILMITHTTGTFMGKGTAACERTNVLRPQWSKLSKHYLYTTWGSMKNMTLSWQNPQRSSVIPTILLRSLFLNATSHSNWSKKGNKNTTPQSEIELRPGGFQSTSSWPKRTPDHPMRFAAQRAMLEEQATEETKSLAFLRMFGFLQVRGLLFRDPRRLTQ